MPRFQPPVRRMAYDPNVNIPIERPEIEGKPYREETFAGYALGIVVGVVLTISMTYAGLRLGFTVPASAMAAMIGLGVLRKAMKVGSIVENNINQTVAAAINITCSGIIFTVPILYLRGVKPDLWTVTLAGIAGSFMGTVFIIPLRKQMIDLERLRFPTGYATATVLKAAGGGNRAVLLAYGAVAGLLWYVLTHLGRIEWLVKGLPDWDAFKKTISWPQLLEIDFHESLSHAIPRYVNPVLELSMTSIAAGFIAGRPALVVVWGGLLANWVVAPAAVRMGWVPPDVLPTGLVGDALDKGHAAAGEYLFKWVSRPIGIGMLVGGALTGIALAWPMIRAAFESLARGSKAGVKAQELSPKLMYVAAAVSIAVVTGVGIYLGLSPLTAIVAGLIASAWMWLAGVIVAQTTGVTDWSPISGMSLIAIVLLLLVVGTGPTGVLTAVTMAVAVGVAMSQAADMMQDLKTGHLVGAIPRKQQIAQMWVAWIGPIVSVLTLALLFQAAVNDRSDLEPREAFRATYNAPQANALSTTIDVMTGQSTAVAGASSTETFIRYGIGAVIGTGLTLAAGGGMGVQVGLSMYLPFSTIAAFGIGCLLCMLYEKKFGTQKLEDWAIPVAAGLLVGDSLAGVVDSMLYLL
jgi:uncharacterized oligopeptide transporter (OPT) family protein